MALMIVLLIFVLLMMVELITLEPFIFDFDMLLLSINESVMLVCIIVLELIDPFSRRELEILLFRLSDSLIELFVMLVFTMNELLITE